MNVAKLKKRCQQPKQDLLRDHAWRLIDNGASVLGVAHCDSVTCGMDHFRITGKTVHSTSLDDRLGVYILMDILPAMGISIDVLLTDDEEKGQSTAQLFSPDKQYNWIFSFDRHGLGAVVYEYSVMEPFAIKYFGKAHPGSFSDISFLEHLGCGGINIGTGYYNEHTPRSFARLNETEAQIKRFVKFYQEWHNIHISHEQLHSIERTQWDSWDEIDDDYFIEREYDEDELFSLREEIENNLR